MSFSTVLQIIVHDEINLEDYKNQIVAMLERDGIHSDLFNDLLDAFDDGEASFNCHAAYLYQLMPEVAKLIGDNASFDARGLGDEFALTWVQSFSEGNLENSCALWDHGFEA